MYKRIIFSATAAILLTGAAVSAQASNIVKYDQDNLSWQQLGAQQADTGFHEQQTVEGTYQVGRLTLALNVDGKVNLYRVYTVPHTVCPSKQPTNHHAVQVINGQPVKITYYCSAQGIITAYPKSGAAQQYVIDQLKTKESINWHGFTYSAMGFSRAYNDITKLENEAI